MSKAILILDEMPECCMECRLKYLDTGDDAYFGANVYRCIWDGSEILKSGKDEWCPLKPLPEKKHNNGGYKVIDGTEWFYDSEHDDGWNECIDEILGEEKND